MRIKLLTLISLIVVLSYIEGTCQLPNSNMYLLKNLNLHTPPPGTAYSALWGYKAPNGREYAILGCYNGTAFVDITDSANIHEVDFIPGGSNRWREMKTYSHYAYIVSELSNSKLLVVDLQYLPDSVHVVTTWSYAGYGNTHSIQQDGPYLYLHGGNVNVTPNGLGGGEVVVDVSNPEAPVKRGSWNSKYVHDSRVINDTIYACNIYTQEGATISVIDARNKDSLKTITSWVNGTNPFPHNCDRTDDGRYLLTTDETSNVPGKLKVWDIENIMDPIFVTSWQPTGITTSIVHNVEIYGNFAILAHYSAGVRVLNISDPTKPVEIAWYDTYPSSNVTEFAGCWGVYMFPSGKIIASDKVTGLYVLKTTMDITGIEGGNGSLPSTFKLEQNYPNPFNPATTINFSLPRNARVVLEIFDITGKTAAVLVNDRRDAGNYNIQFDAAKYGLTSGIYFYKVTASSLEGTFSETKKMMLVK